MGAPVGPGPNTSSASKVQEAEESCGQQQRQEDAQRDPRRARYGARGLRADTERDRRSQPCPAVT